MSTKRTYTSEEIGKMTPSERSAAWHGATPESQKALHAANQTALGGSHSYDSESGVWRTKNPSGPRTYSAREVSNLAGGYNFDEGRIRSLFDKATKTEFAAKKAANEATQNQYAGNVGGYINTLSDTMRQSLNKAVATGGSRGLAAAQAMQAAQEATAQTAEDANALALERMQLDYDEAEAYAKNIRDAEALAMERKVNALNQGINLGGLDAQRYAADQGVVGNYYYGGDAARQNGYYGLKTADIEAETTRRGQDLDAESNLRAQLIGAMQSSNMTEEGRKFLEQFLGFPEGSFQNAPIASYGGGGYGSYSGSGDGNYNGDWVQYGTEADTNLNKALLAGNKGAYTGYYQKYNPGSGQQVADDKYEENYKKLIYDPTQSMGYNDFIKYMKQRFGASEETAAGIWKRHGKSVPATSEPQSTVNIVKTTTSDGKMTITTSDGRTYTRDVHQY